MIPSPSSNGSNTRRVSSIGYRGHWHLYSDPLNRASSRRLLTSYLLPSLFASYTPLSSLIPLGFSSSQSAGLPSLPPLAMTEYSKSVLLPPRPSFGWTSTGVALLLPLYWIGLAWNGNGTAEETHLYLFLNSSLFVSNPSLFGRIFLNSSVPDTKNFLAVK